MAPPPDSGDAKNKNDDDPLGGMDPMAWLESLAARQGANRDELTTAANLDIPVLPPDTVIDEPGYTPGYDTGKSEIVKPEPAKVPPPEPTKAVEPPPPAPEPVASAADPLGGMDPMAWLESLAARQGANRDELVTAANLDIPMPPADSVIDEPGYIDYDPFGGTGATRVQETPRAAEPPPAPSAPQPAPAAASIEDPLGGMDPLAWLESLTSGQSESPETLFAATSPEPSGFGDQIEGIDMSAFTETETEAAPAMSFEEAAELLGIDASTISSGTEDPLSGMDPLAWLESLTSGQGGEASEFGSGIADLEGSGIDSSAFAATRDSGEAAMAPESTLSWLEELAKDQVIPLETPAAETSEMAADSTPGMGGMSDDINEVQAWLFAQARQLEQTRQELEEEEMVGEDLPPAVAAEIPDWLSEVAKAPPTPSTPALSTEIKAPDPSELPAWLTQSDAEATPSDLEAELLGALTGQAAQPAPQDVAESTLAPGELEALTRPTSPETVDPLAEALNEEYARIQAGDDSIPDWYLEAMARAKEEQPAPTTQAAPPPQAEMFTPDESFAAEVPDWLVEEGVAEPALPGDIPDWLRGIAEPETAAAAATPDWLAAKAAEPEVADLPDWLKPTAEPAADEAVVAKAPEPTPEPVKRPEPAPVAPAAVPVVAPPPRPSTPAPAPARISPPPTGEQMGFLKQARELAASNQFVVSLEHYQVLIDAGQLLEETRGDLRQLVESNPKEPKLRRLLGDTHMRLGDLQAALDMYRSALDQL